MSVFLIFSVFITIPCIQSISQNDVHRSVHHQQNREDAKYVPLVVRKARRPRVSDLQKAELAWLAANSELPERVHPSAPRARPLYPQHHRTTNLPRFRQIPATRLIPVHGTTKVSGPPQAPQSLTYKTNYWPPYVYGEPYPYTQYGRWYVPQVSQYGMYIQPEQVKSLLAAVQNILSFLRSRGSPLDIAETVLGNKNASGTTETNEMTAVKVTDPTQQATTPSEGITEGLESTTPDDGGNLLGSLLQGRLDKIDWIGSLFGTRQMPTKEEGNAIAQIFQGGLFGPAD